MKKVLLIALCFAIPMAGFAQKKKKKGAEPEVLARFPGPLLIRTRCPDTSSNSTL